ncbi:unnamed protein product [Meloidogyne enterolobii]|uniref:Uncharacterized protein n=1 Tax=Meloidogyne enterolobii TaxID=390850 RepID=A0ACB0Y7G0_MELEN
MSFFPKKLLFFKLKAILSHAFFFPILSKFVFKNTLPPPFHLFFFCPNLRGNVLLQILVFP